MSTLTFALETPGINIIGITIDGTLPWGNRRLTCRGVYTWINTIVTGTDCFIPSYYVSDADDIVVTVSNIDGTGASTIILTASAGSYQHNVDLPVFVGRGGGGDVQTRVQIRLAGNNNDLLDADALLKVSAIGTPSLSLPLNYGPVTSIGSPLPYIGIEGGATTSSINGYSTVKAAIGGHTVNSTKIRFKAACEAISLLVFHNHTSWHLNRLNADGSSGLPLDSGHSVIDAGTNQFENWLVLATGLNPNTEALYEITSANPDSTLMAAIMTSGGTGINSGASELVRPLKFVGLGDSRMVGLIGTNGSLPGRVDLGVMEHIGQHYNCQVVNGGINGSKITDWNTGNYWNILSNLPAGSPIGVIFDFGINDVFAAETVTNFSAAYNAGLTIARNKLPSTAFLVEGIKPTTAGGQTFASLHVYNAGDGTEGSGVQGVVEALTLSGDTRLTYVDTESWHLAGEAWNAGSTFETINYADDQIHENSIGQRVDAEHLYPLLSGLFDSTPPMVPAGLSQNFNAMVAITVTWIAATDAENLSSTLIYRVYRDGVWIATTAAGITSFFETVVADETSHFYKVRAEDPSGNLSEFSTSLSVIFSTPMNRGIGGSRLSIGLC